MSDADVLAHLKAFINEEVPFAGFCGIVVTEITESDAKACLPARDELLNHVGSQHAGALFTAAETASGACMLGLVGDRFSTVTPLVRSSSIAYRRPAAGEIVAAARAETTRQRVHDELSRDGRCDFTVVVDMRNRKDQVVATAEMAWHVRVRDS